MATAKKTLKRAAAVNEATPAKDGQPIHVAVRLDPETLARVDALRDAMSTPWLKAKRSDALRALVLEALPILEERFAKPQKGGRA